MKYKHIFLAASLLSLNVFAQDYGEDWDYQETEDTVAVKAQINYTNTNRVDDLLEKRKRINKEDNTVKAFRIQIYSGSRSGSADAKNRFKKLYPKVLVETSYEQPYFKTKVAGYRTRLEAQRALNIYKQKFRSAFIYEEKISIDKL